MRPQFHFIFFPSCLSTPDSRVQFKVLLFVFRALNGPAPSDVAFSLPPGSLRSLRSVPVVRLTIPTEAWGRRLKCLCSRGWMTYNRIAFRSINCLRMCRKYIHLQHFDLHFLFLNYSALWVLTFTSRHVRCLLSLHQVISLSVFLYFLQGDYKHLIKELAA